MIHYCVLVVYSTVTEMREEKSREQQNNRKKFKIKPTRLAESGAFLHPRPISMMRSTLLCCIHSLPGVTRRFLSVQLPIRVIFWNVRPLGTRIRTNQTVGHWALTPHLVVGLQPYDDGLMNQPGQSGDCL